MREIRQSGSEGGAAGDNPAVPTPICAALNAHPMIRIVLAGVCPCRRLVLVGRL